ncbi:SDR family NAD(P)-dependent oxidoreductase [Desulfopila aestuarii]|nr:SDR family NAD(P)-dependent oxidoreductase [Desulfopila aestuarii]
MTKTILLTGATDGIGLETAKMLAPMGHTLLLHGRNSAKLEKVVDLLKKVAGAGQIETYTADLSIMRNVAALAAAIAEKHDKLDVLINNAGVYGAPDETTEDGFDIRFAVNTLAPYLLTKKLLPLMNASGRVINLSSAAQASVAPQALRGERFITSDNLAYAQSKLALTMWSIDLASSLGENGPAIIAVNPMSMLGSKMVKEAYGVEGADLRIGADILCRAAFSDEFAKASGKYFDNDISQFSSPHPDALHPGKCADIVATIETILAEKLA